MGIVNHIRNVLAPHSACANYRLTPRLCTEMTDVFITTKLSVTIYHTD